MESLRISFIRELPTRPEPTYLVEYTNGLVERWTYEKMHSLCGRGNIPQVLIGAYVRTMEICVN
jgi:hypothetical protein